MDLNGLLSATSQAAATIIAIIGGFIVSKLLEENSERKTIFIQLKDIEDEISVRTKIKEEAFNWLVQEFCEHLIAENADSLIDNTPFEDVIEGKKLEYDKNLVNSYWCKASAICTQILDYLDDDDNDMQLNEDDIPINFAMNLNEFEYTVCKTIIECLPSYSAGNFDNHLRFNPNIRYWVGINDNEKVVSENNNELKILKLKNQQLINRKEAIIESKIMVRGLIIFVLYSLFSVILPLCFMPVSESISHCAFLWIKWVDIALFIIGFIAVVFYLITLLKPKNKLRTNKNKGGIS